MKAQKILGLICLVTLALPMLASAQVYKWKDKNGVTRYSDMPPPVTVKQLDMVGRKKAPRKVVSEPEANETEEPSKPVVTKNEELIELQESAEENAAKIRAKNAEIERKNNLQKQKQAKIDMENCKAAKANYKTYSQGGRVYSINEKGERVFQDDSALAANKQKAQAEIQQFCK